MRYAIYYTPAREQPLARAAAAWLGRDPFGGEATPAQPVAGLSSAEIAFHTAAARRYGFHATLKAPFRLAPGESEANLSAVLDGFAAATPAVNLPRLKVGGIDGFLALVPAEPLPALDALAGNVVRAFDRFRAPLTESEIERRTPDALSAAEFRNLCQWGYPHAFDTFRFHMTLTGRVGMSDRDRLRAALDETFAGLLEQPLVVDALTLFVESEAGAPFMAQSRHPLACGIGGLQGSTAAA